MTQTSAMPICPIVGFSEAGAPLINARLSGEEAANQTPYEVLRRLGLASPVMLCMPAAVLEAAATAANFALFTRVVDATGHTDPMMEMQRRGPSARAWLAIAVGLALVVVGVRFALK